jgi:signal transduction histidine kinase
MGDGEGSGNGDAGALKNQLAAAEAIAHVGSWRWLVATGEVTWSDELYRIYGFEPGSRPITLEFFLSRLRPDDRERIQGEVRAALGRPGRFAYREVILRPDGTPRTLDTVGETLTDAAGQVIGLVGTCRDITEQCAAELIQQGEQRALEMLAANAPLRAILTQIVTSIEAAAPGTIASIVLLDDDGATIRHGAAPGLPVSYGQALDGVRIGPRVGSCGTAMFRREPVVVADIETDPLWADYLELARPYGLRACWSVPILSNAGNVLGSFALYHREPRAPDAAARAMMDRAVHVAAIVLERRALDEQLSALAGRLEATREDERTSIARDIHDQLGQALTALKLDLGWLQRRITDPALDRKLHEMVRSADDLIATVRRISTDLRPGILDDIGLRAAIEWQAEEFQRRTGTPCVVRSELSDVQLERSLATTVFRIFQEALTNVVRHASASAVEVTLGLDRGQLRLEIADDGVGLPDLGPRGSTLGILGMGERARRQGGQCTVRRRNPRGTVVSVVVPLRFPAERTGVGRP